MAIYQLGPMLDQYAHDFLVLEINHLFISSTLREEIWLLRKREDPDFLRHVLFKARDYNLTEIDGDRNFETYSGGQKATLACLVVMAAVGIGDIRNLRILLINVLESISGENRRLLTAALRELQHTNDIRVFTGGPGQIEELA